MRVLDDRRPCSADRAFRPMLMLMTSAPLSAAYRIPRATTSSVATFGDPPKRKSQTLSSTLTGISLTLNATPAAPMPSFVSWPIVPLTCVPWPLEIERIASVPDEIVRRDETALTGRDQAAAPPEYGIVTRPSAG